MRDILDAAGFRTVRCQSHETDMSVGGATGVDGAVAFLLTIGPVASLLRESDADTRSRVAESIRAALLPYADGNRVSLSSATWVVQADARP